MLIFPKVLHTLFHEITKDDPSKYFWFFYASPSTIMNFYAKEEWLEEEILTPRKITAQFSLCHRLPHRNVITEILRREPQATLHFNPGFDPMCEEWLDLDKGGYLIYSDITVPYGKLLLKRVTQNKPYIMK